MTLLMAMLMTMRMTVIVRMFGTAAARGCRYACGGSFQLFQGLAEFIIRPVYVFNSVPNPVPYKVQTYRIQRIGNLKVSFQMITIVINPVLETNFRFLSLIHFGKPPM
jgi:hypothetical protein